MLNRLFVPCSLSHTICFTSEAYPRNQNPSSTVKQCHIYLPVFIVPGNEKSPARTELSHMRWIEVDFEWHQLVIVPVLVKTQDAIALLLLCWRGTRCLCRFRPLNQGVNAAAEIR